jgi:tetratricopeptide (TPR) repeat protein
VNLYICQRAAGWITEAFLSCYGLYAQTGNRAALEFREHTSPTVTFQELRHIVPRAAQAEMERADRARLKHQPEQVIDHLKKAVLIDPEFIAARNNLGICLLETEPASAVGQFEEAIKVNPRKGLLYNNLAVAYAVIHNLEAADRAARMAVDLDRTSNRARALLGLVLYQQHKYTAEASALLERASGEYSSAHLFAALVLVARGEFQKAGSHAQAYLSSGAAEYRKDASDVLVFIDRTGQERASSPDRF